MGGRRNPASLNLIVMRLNGFVLASLFLGGCATVSPPSGCRSGAVNSASWRRLATPPVDASRMRHVLAPDRETDAQPIPNESWFASSDGRIMACEMPASEGCSPWHAVFVESALGWETERGAVMVSSAGTCKLNRITIGWSDRGSRLRWAKEEVDDWDQVPSFDAGEAPRRST